MLLLRCSLLVFLTLLAACAGRSSSQPAAHAPGAQPASPTLHLIAGSLPPFVDSVDQPRVALDLVTSALARAGYIANTEIVPMHDVVPSLEAGKFDGSAALWRSEEREALLLYSEPYLENRLMLLGRKGAPVDATSFDQLAGKKIGIVEGLHAYGPELEQAKGPQFVVADSSEQNLRALLRGELDYVLADALVVHELLHHFPEQTQAKLAIGTQPLLKRTLHLTLRKSVPNAQQILDRFNQELARMLQDGSYHQALHVDWIHADIDGDGHLEMVAVGDQLGSAAPRAGYQVISLPGGTPSDHQNAKFVVKGQACGSWDAVPEEYKRDPVSPMGNTPNTLRASVFEF